VFTASIYARGRAAGKVVCDRPRRLITFAIPFERGIPVLARSIKSILGQGDSSWQALVYDLGAEEGIESVVKSFGQGKVRYVRAPADQSVGASYNACLALAETDLVTILDADGELLASYHEVMSSAATRYPEAAALFCRAEIMDAQGHPTLSVPDFIKDVLINPALREEVTLEGEPGVHAILKGNFIVAGTLCFRKSALGARRFREDCRIVLVRDLTTRLLVDGDALVGLPARAYRYRGHNETSSAKHAFTEQWFKEEFAYYDSMHEEAMRRGWMRCAALADRRSILKLNVAYRALKNLTLLDLADVRRALRLYRRSRRSSS
jgi:glycosyltransferase involved in cell wall biosynthesis